MICFNDVSRCIDQLSDRYLNLLENICNIESNSYDKNGIDKVADYITDYEKANEYLFERMFFEKAGDCLCIDFVSNIEKPWIALSAHMDTVHKAGTFGYPPFKRDDEFIYGPGVCDCKGGIAVGLLAMAALKNCGFNDLNIRLILQSDEEVSSSLSDKATVKYICNKAKNCIAFLNLEGRYPGKLTLERGGIIHAKFTVKGKSAHSKDNESGINAINEAVFKIADITKSPLNQEVSFNCGIIQGGVASNVVAEICSFDIEARIATKDKYDDVLNYFKELADKQYISGTKTDLKIVSDRIPMELKDFNVELLNKINDISIKYGFGKIEARKSLGGSDAAYTTDVGIPSADGMGIVGYGLHSVNEKAKIKSLTESAKLLAAILIELP